MASSTKNVKLGTCNVFFDNQDLGLTKGGVEVEVATSTHEVMVDQFGQTPIGELINGRTVTASIPLAETTLDNLLKIMPGSELITDGEFATGTVTFGAAVPSDDDKVDILGVTFTFKTVPVNATDMPIPATVEEAAQLLADKINGTVAPFYATFSGAVVTVLAESRSTDANVAITTTGTDITVDGMTGGLEVTSAVVKVSTGVSLNLLDFARELRLRPIGTAGDDDFIIHRAAAPGALNFTYGVDQERIYTANFKGYVDDTGGLFSIGNSAAG